MRLYEFEGCKLFQNEGIPVPKYALATSPQEARAKAGEIGFPVVVKAQVLSGGRYLAGGVHSADTPEEVETVARRIFEKPMLGFKVQQVMVSQKIDIIREYYLGISLDDYHGRPMAILSVEGGVSVNRLVQERPESVVTKSLSIAMGLDSDDARQMCRQVGLRGEDAVQVANLLSALYRVFRKNDALVAEINPLVKAKDGTFFAIDSKVEMDDAGIFRHQELGFTREGHMVNELERKGRAIGVSYVEMDGDIAIIASGAGLGMASIDVIAKTMKPANFLETGGGISEDLLYKATDLVLSKPGIRALYISVYGGINPIHEGAKGVVRYLKEKNIKIPVVAKALGNRQEETWEILRSGGVNVVTEVSTEAAVAELSRMLEGK
ncbi:MAG: acetate--CoA ligase family protein [Dehalococcoidales bacterium]|nr:acetate--CoA ligase family protein [Dehalococcoidales bacterium]